MTPITRVQSLVARAYGITREVLVSREKSATVAEARQVAMLLARRLDPEPSLPELGRAFGNRDHTTIRTQIMRIEGRAETEPKLRARIDLLRAQLDAAPIDLTYVGGLRKIDLDDNYLTERAARFAGSGAE